MFSSDVFENLTDDYTETIIKFIEFLNLYQKLVVKQQKIEMQDEIAFPLYSQNSVFPKNQTLS